MAAKKNRKRSDDGSDRRKSKKCHCGKEVVPRRSKYCSGLCMRVFIDARKTREQKLKYGREYRARERAKVVRQRLVDKPRCLECNELMVANNLLKRKYCSLKCQRRYLARKFREKNIDRERARSRAYYEANKEKHQKYRKAYYQRNRLKLRKWAADYRRANAATLAIRGKHRYLKNRPAVLAQAKKYYQKNRQAICNAVRARYKSLSPDDRSKLGKDKQCRKMLRKTQLELLLLAGLVPNLLSQ